MMHLTYSSARTACSGRLASALSGPLRVGGRSSMPALLMPTSTEKGVDYAIPTTAPPRRRRSAGREHVARPARCTGLRRPRVPAPSTRSIWHKVVRWMLSGDVNADDAAHPETTPALPSTAVCLGTQKFPSR